MQTFIDSKQLARNKDLNSFFRQNSNFILSEKAEAGSAEEQPARNTLTGENNKAVEQNPTAFNQKSFLSQMP